MINLLKRFRKPAAVSDVRGRRFVVMIDCILNQNARDCGAARFPAMNFELVSLCHAHQVGILQMPRPEIAALGFKRTRPAGKSIRDVLDTEAGWRCCAKLAHDMSERIEIYLAEGYELLAILGGNPRSPGCAVLDGDDGLLEESGIFMRTLQTELQARKLTVRFRGIRDHDPALLEQDLQWSRGLLEQPSS